ncbi:MAG: DNA polymerase/3'-5' exonuclease PolX [bacterium]|nr:DNA polymerase/3'-5' exonuclease PolX [bacterium]
MTNQELAKIFQRISLFLAMRGVPFKPQAYEKVAFALESLAEDVGTIYTRDGRKGLAEIPGVGEGIAEKIEEYIKTGKIRLYEQERKRMPVDVEELTSLEGVGPKMVAELYRKLRIRNLKDLEKAAQAGKLKKLPRFGEKTERNILQAIGFAKRREGRKLLGDIYPFVRDYELLLKESGLVQQVAPAGSFRRQRETVGDIDILVTSKTPKNVIDYVLSHIPHEKLWGKGPTKISLRTTHGFDIDVRVLTPENFGAGLQYFTGSKEHNVKLRTWAQERGYKISEYGVFHKRKRIICETEEELYHALGLPFIEPELREDQGEIEAALRQSHKKPPGLPKLISYDSLKGDLQVQTDWTDGEHSIEEMAKEAKKQGLEYITITDHTKDLAMTGGLDEKKIRLQMAAIDKAQKKVPGIRILKGAEVNIRKDGTLDVANEALAKLDVVGISVHSLFKMSEKDMTNRICRAMENPNADILFHPTGRLINKREPYRIDMEKLMSTAKKTGTLLEINAFPERLDLKDAHIRMAVEKGVRMVIDSDAHHKDHFRYLRYGIAQARRGWAEKKDIMNTLPLDKFLSSLKDRYHA